MNDVETTTAEKANEYIRAARKALKPPRVTLNKFPRWLQRRCQVYLKSLRQRRDICAVNILVDVASYIAADMGLDVSSPWMDHWGTFVHQDGKKRFVSEPYNCDSATLALCETIAKRLQIGFYASSNSWWYPGYTMSLVFYELTSAVSEKT